MSIIPIYSAEQFQSLISTLPHVLVKYTATWCGPCKKIEPLVKQVANKGNITVLEVDVDVNSWLPQQHMVVPTFQLYQAGVKRAEWEGASPDRLMELLRF